MPETFTSHEFILELARQNQLQYVEALYNYRTNTHRGSHAPFMTVHGILAKHLLNYPQFISQINKEVPSKNIFGEDDMCSEWRKL
jgi:hypothetical protein